MIREVQLDIFQVEADIITCPVNAVGVMGAGLAKEFANRDPHLESWYKSHYGSNPNTDSRKLMVYRGNPNVLLFPTKIHFRDDSPPDLVEFNLKTLARVSSSWNGRTLAIPALGCGLGKMDYHQDLWPMLERHFTDHPVTLLVCV